MAHHISPKSHSKSQTASFADSNNSSRANSPISSNGFRTFVSLSPIFPILANPTLEQLRRVTCPECDIACTDTETFVDCAHCMQRFHPKCAGVTQSAFRAMHGKPQFAWYCASCVSKRGNIKSGGGDTSMQFNALMEGMSKMMKRLDDMDKRLVSKENLEVFEKKMEDMMDSKIEDAMGEKIEKEKRKLNLLFVNVAESVGDREEKMENDKKKVESIMHEILPEDEAKQIKIKSPVRLGAQKGEATKESPICSGALTRQWQKL